MRVSRSTRGIKRAFGLAVAFAAVSIVGAGIAAADPPSGPPPGQGGTPPGQDETFVPPGQETPPAPPGQETPPAPPGQETPPAPPGQDPDFVPPGQDPDFVPPGQDDTPPAGPVTPPGQDPGFVPPGQGGTPPGQDGQPGEPGEVGDPPGNNGTIKVDAIPLDDTHPNNEPHVGCVFGIDFYGFDEGDLFAEVIFEGHPPTGGGVLLTDTVFIGEDPNDGGGSAEGIDASVTYDLTEALSGIEPHDQQGWHVKLTIHADGSQGADTKHKVFWVTGCVDVAPTEETPPEEPENEINAPVQPTPPAPPAIAGVQRQRPAAPATEVLGVQFARTGTDLPALLVTIGVWMLLVGGVALLGARRMARPRLVTF